MSLSAAEIALVVAELAPVVRGALVGKVYQPNALVVTIELGRDRLVLSAEPRASRLHLDPARAPAAGPPPAFAMLLRKRLGGLRLHALELAREGDRVVALDFGAGRDRLLAELTGPHANLFLVEPGGTIVASLRGSGSTSRALTPGAAYVLPPPPTSARASQRFGEPPGVAAGVAARVAAHYHEALAVAHTTDLRERVAVALRRDLGRLRRREQALLGDLDRIARAAGDRKLADLLLAHAARSPGRGATSVTVPDDFEDGAPLTIALDPALDVRENAARLYRQHKRLSGGRSLAENRLRGAREHIAALEARLAALPGLDALALEAATAGPRPPFIPSGGARKRAGGEGRAEPRLPYREHVSLGGDPIWVGRDAAGNDALTFRHARGNDLWLHTRDAAGAHVVVPRRGAARPLADATLLDAATLAAHHSPLAHESQVDVTVTEVKNLRKPRGAAPGLVYVSGARTVRVRMEPARLARLLGDETP